MRNNVLFAILAVLVSFAFDGCKKISTNKSAAIIISEPGNENFVYCDEDESKNITVFVERSKYFGSRLEAWSISPAGKVLSQKLIDSGDNFHFIGISKMDNKGYAFVTFGYPNPSGCFMYGTDNLVNRTLKKYLGIGGRHLYWDKGYLVLSTANNAGNKFTRFDASGNKIDSVIMKQNIIPPGFPGKINSSMNAMAPLNDGYVYAVSFDKQNGPYTRTNYAVCTADKTGKLVKAYYINQNLSFNGDFVATNDGGFLYVSTTSGSKALPFPNERTVAFKFSATGDSTWCKYYGNSETYIYGGDAAKGGGYYLYGSCGNIEHSGVAQGYVAKIDVNGDIVWEQKMEGWLNSNVNAVKELSDGSLCCVGTTSNAAAGKTGTDGFLVFLKADGSFR